MTRGKPEPPPRANEPGDDDEIEPGDLVIELGPDGVPLVYTQPEEKPEK
jgi:hypothetical protein